MSWLLPLGFVGLIGLAVLLIIYLIKPNYQNKLVSSTFVWKLSLKYQKKRIPISKVKNLLILLLQILILTLCAFILAGPVIVKEVNDPDEVVIIIDASASMRATNGNTTRFNRAIDDARSLAAKTFDKGGRVSLIFADKDADYIAHRATSDSRADLDLQLQKLQLSDACTYGSADIDGAMTLAGSIVESVPDARVVLYTSTSYDNHSGVEVHTMAADDGSEWNVAVLDLRAEKTVENTYTFYVDLACYGRDIEVTLEFSLKKVNNNDDGLKYSLSIDPVRMERIRLVGNRTTTVTIPTDVAVPEGKDKAVPVFTFDEVTAAVRLDDSLLDDNSFSLFGNIKQTMNIQYASSRPNSFFAAAFMSLQTTLQNRWTVNFREIRTGEEAASSGYDLYVFEEDAVPQIIPSDGVVFFVNPRNLPMGSDFGMTSAMGSATGIALDAGDDHPITKNIFAGNIEVTRYSGIQVFNADPSKGGYTTLLRCEGDPVLVCKNTAASKMVVMSFSMNYSTAAMSYDFPRLILNIANYYMPSTFDKTVYEVNDTISLNARGATLSLVGPGVSKEYKEFPQTLPLTRIGTYTTTQKTISGAVVVEKFFVRIPKYESNIMRSENVLKNQAKPVKRQRQIEDLCVYFAAVLVAFLILERLLQSRSMS